ncbi:MAG: enoyl-CoA hydratase/carnithine racemase [Candidatus Azotimanducaceae bacterium]|jgi:enoyl-CoA hydratase/carnithine racemase
MMVDQFKTIQSVNIDGVLTATISNPPINIMTQDLYADLVPFFKQVSEDPEVRVLVMESADPDFFIAHYDVETILTMPTDTPAEKSEALNPFHQMCETVRTMPKPTIAKINGRVGGGGNELCSNFDMRYGVLGKTIINQMEVPLGILPGGTGTQRLPQLVGRSRAMEIILGADDLDAETAEKWGYLNRAFATTQVMDQFVDKLSQRMALWPPEAIALAKRSVLAAEPSGHDGMREEAYCFQQTLRTSAAQESMTLALEGGAQTREGEMRINELCKDMQLARQKG